VFKNSYVFSAQLVHLIKMLFNSIF